jgi:hypothetical protein
MTAATGLSATCSRNSSRPLSGGFDAAHRVDDDQPVGAVHDGQVADVAVADLIDPFDDLVEAPLVDHLGLTPQARIDRVGPGRVVGQVGVRPEVEHDLPVVPEGSAVRDRRDQPAARVGEVLPIGQVVEGFSVAIRRSGGRCCRLWFVGHPDP